MIAAAAAVVAGVAVWVLSLGLEPLRRVPQPPARLRWGPSITVGYVDVGGYRLRHVTAGRGPDLLLLHTLRTQLDLFEKVVPALAESFTVHAVDLPGHGFSTSRTRATTPSSSSGRSNASSTPSISTTSPSAGSLSVHRSRSSSRPGTTRGSAGWWRSTPTTTTAGVAWHAARRSRG